MSTVLGECTDPSQEITPFGESQFTRLAIEHADKRGVLRWRARAAVCGCKAYRVEETTCLSQIARLMAVVAIEEHSARFDGTPEEQRQDDYERKVAYRPPCARVMMDAGVEGKTLQRAFGHRLEFPDREAGIVLARVSAGRDHTVVRERCEYATPLMLFAWSRGPWKFCPAVEADDDARSIEHCSGMLSLREFADKSEEIVCCVEIGRRDEQPGGSISLSQGVARGIPERVRLPSTTWTSDQVESTLD
ncbi:MAG: hypothetical protein J0I07_41355 [Myxococcales bacterium]|nr:hypothetical protein [Myxococcales bacterium]